MCLIGWLTIFHRSKGESEISFLTFWYFPLIIIADLDVYPTALIADGANAAANAGDATDNAFTMTWRVGTAEGDMNAIKLIEQSVTPDRYVTNVLFNLIADN